MWLESITRTDPILCIQIRSQLLLASSLINSQEQRESKVSGFNVLLNNILKKDKKELKKKTRALIKKRKNNQKNQQAMTFVTFSYSLSYIIELVMSKQIFTTVFH